MKNLKYVKDFIYQNKYRYLIGIICILIVDLFQLILPKVLGQITDKIKSGELNNLVLMKYVIIIALFGLGIAFFRFCWRYFVFGVSKRIEKQIRERFYFHLQKLSTNYYDKNKTGDLMAHATNDIENIRMAFGPGVALSVDSTTIPIVAIIMMFNTVGPKLSLAAFSPLILLAIIIGIFAKVMHLRIQTMQEAFSKLTEKARENFSGIRVIKSFTQEKDEVNNFEEVNKYNKQMNLRFIRLTSTLFPLVMTVSSLSFAISLIFGGIFVIENKITLGDFVAFNSYLGMLIWPTAALGYVLNLLKRGSVSLERINKILDEVPEVQNGINAIKPPSIRGKIRFNNLSFSYPRSNTKVLKNISLEVMPSKTLAIVGKTGSGKSSLVSLILRLYNVEKNSLIIDDIDINNLEIDSLRSNIGYVPQDTFLFSTTIRENIDFFNNKPQSEIENASKKSHVYDNIIDFPYKFDTVVGERGITLSGGQKQRIAIARALLLSPKILILDDCLSAVDTQTEENILKELTEIMKDRTSIIISHRISTIKHADEIIVLDNGEIVERGNHKSLLEIKGIYYDLHQKQLLTQKISEED